MTSRKTRRLRAMAVAIGTTVLLAVGASAASLGGLGGADLGADAVNVGSCDADGITYEFRQGFNRRSGEYRVNRVILRDVSVECRGLPFSITLFESGVGGATATTSGAALAVRNVRDTDPGPGVDRAGVSRINVRMLSGDVEGIALTIGDSLITP
jgi:hypothetical protein